MHVEQGHIQLTKKGNSFLFAMSASAREFCEEQRKNPSADTIKRRQNFEAYREKKRAQEAESSINNSNNN